MVNRLRSERIREGVDLRLDKLIIDIRYRPALVSLKELPGVVESYRSAVN